MDSNGFYLAGDFLVETKYTATASGFVLEVSPIGTLEDNIVRIDGQLLTLTEDTETILNPSVPEEDQFTGSNLAVAFATYARGNVANNAVYVKDGVRSYSELG